MRSIYFNVDCFDTVNACMIECMKIQKALKEQKVLVDLRTKKDKYDHIKWYEIVFKSDEDYMVYQFLK